MVVGHSSPGRMLAFLQDMCMRCVSLLHFSSPADDPGHCFALSGMTGATGFEVLSINLALAGLQRKEGGAVKAPHWVAGDLSSTLHSATKKYHC